MIENLQKPAKLEFRIVKVDSSVSNRLKKTRIGLMTRESFIAP